MKTLIHSTICCFLAICLNNDLLAQDYNACVQKISSEWGEDCEKCEYYTEGYKRSYQQTYRATFQNVCGDKIELKVAMQEQDKTWRTFPVKVLDPEQTFTAYACKGSGKYMFWVRKLDDREIVLPTDKQIITQYR